MVGIATCLRHPFAQQSRRMPMSSCVEISFTIRGDRLLLSQDSRPARPKNNHFHLSRRRSRAPNWMNGLGRACFLREVLRPRILRWKKITTPLCRRRGGSACDEGQSNPWDCRKTSIRESGCVSGQSAFGAGPPGSPQLVQISSATGGCAVVLRKRGPSGIYHSNLRQLESASTEAHRIQIVRSFTSFGLPIRVSDEVFAIRPRLVRVDDRSGARCRCRHRRFARRSSPAPHRPYGMLARWDFTREGFHHADGVEVE